MTRETTPMVKKSRDESMTSSQSQPGYDAPDGAASDNSGEPLDFWPPRAESLLWLLRIIEGAGGSLDCSDGPRDALAVFCNPTARQDIFNEALERGLTRVTNDNRFDIQTVHITEAGRETLNAATASPEGGPLGLKTNQNLTPLEKELVEALKKIAAVKFGLEFNATDSERAAYWHQQSTIQRTIARSALSKAESRQKEGEQ